MSNTTSSDAALPPDYQKRAETFGFASPGDVVKAMNEPGVIVLDVRTKGEIEEQGTVAQVNPETEYVYSNCTPAKCPELTAEAGKLLPNKDATIVIHCASGRRAATAQRTLEGQGYSNVLNAGGLADVKAILGQN